MKRTISSQLVSHVMEEAFTRTATYQKVIHSTITKYVPQDQTLTGQTICAFEPGQSGHRFAQEMFERLTIPSQFTLPHIFHFIGFRFVSSSAGVDGRALCCAQQTGMHILVVEALLVIYLFYLGSELILIDIRKPFRSSTCCHDLRHIRYSTGESHRL